MSTITAELVSGQTAVVGMVSSREAYEVEVSSGIAGAQGVGINSANVIAGMLNLTLSNGAIVNAGSVMAFANTGTITFNGNTIGQFSNGSININANNNIWTFSANGALLFPDNTVQATAYTGTGKLSFSNTTIAVTNTTSNTPLTLQVNCNNPSASPPFYGVRTFIFGADGSIEYPDNTKQFTAWTGSVGTVSGSDVQGGILRVTTFTSATNAIHEIDMEGGGNTGVFYYDLATNTPRGYGSGWLEFVTTATVGAQTANNTLYLGGVAANQYAYANQITTTDRLTVRSTTVLLDNGANTWVGSVGGASQTAGLKGDSNTLFTFSGNGAAVMSMQTDGSLFVGDTMGISSPLGVPGNYSGWIVAMSGIKSAYSIFANSTIQAVGELQTNSGIRFSDNTYQTTAVSAYTLPAANSTTLGGVKVDGTTITIASNTISANLSAYTGNVSITGNITLTGNLTGNTAGFEIGYKDVPQNYTNTSFTVALSDRGKHIYTANGTSQTITIANNSSVAFPIGTAISIVSAGAGTITIARGTGVTLYLAANNTSADRTISSYGMATLLKVATDTWFINGAGVA